MLYELKDLPTNRTHWCGPSALAMLTGLTYKEALRLLKEVTGKKVVKGVYDQQMRRALTRLGFIVNPEPVGEKTLAAWLRERNPEQMRKTFLITVTGHYMVAAGRKGGDNKTKGPVWISDMPKRRATMKGAISVQKTDVVPVRIKSLRAAWKAMDEKRAVATAAAPSLRIQIRKKAEGIGLWFDRGSASIILRAPPGKIIETISYSPDVVMEFPIPYHNLQDILDMLDHTVVRVPTEQERREFGIEDPKPMKSVILPMPW